MEIKAIIVDDEPLAIQGLKAHLDKVSFIQLVGTCEDALDAISCLNTTQADLMFLDIQMPELTGIDLLRTLKKPPIVIITTAFPEFAIEGYELSVLDYLLKPVTFERFIKACLKAKDYFEHFNSSKQLSYFFIKCGKRIEKINYAEILFVEAAQNYILIHTDNKKYTTYLTFKSVADFLPDSEFVKVQKSYIVAISKIDSIEGDEISINGQRIPISSKSKDEIVNKILKGNYLKR